jgi:hypothetical protein
MKKVFCYISLLVILLFVSDQLFAQDDDYSKEKDKPENPKYEKKSKPFNNLETSRYVFGGGLGLQFGNPTLIEISPKIGYRLTEKTIVGGGVTYMYYSENQGGYGTYVASDYGGSIYGSYEPFDNIFGWAEFEVLNYGYKIPTIDITRKWIGSPLIGIGYRQPLGEKGFIQLLLLYNLNYTTDSPYSSPVITRISFFL